MLRAPAVVDNAGMIDPPKCKRRLFQFSLRMLLIVTVVVAIGAGWLGRKIERKRREREAPQDFIPTDNEAFVAMLRERITALNTAQMAGER